VVERLVLLADHTPVTAHELARFMPGAAEAPQPVRAPQPLAGADVSLHTMPLVRTYQSAQSHSSAGLQAVLAEHQGNQTRAAQALGLSLRQLGYRLRKAGLR